MSSWQSHSDSAAGSELVPGPNKRQKRSNDESEASRHNKACSNCRRLKVRCHSPEDSSICSRCARLQLVCLREKKSWTNADDDAWQTQQTLVKLERALEDVLERLQMPALDLYVQPSIVKTHQAMQSTRQNSEEPDQTQRDVSPAPMNSLIEATQMNGLRSQIRPLNQRRKGGGRRMDTDIISEKLLTLEEAEDMLDMFKRNLSAHLFSASIPSDATVESLRRSSTPLFTAVILVTALHLPGKEELHERCHRRFLGLVSSTMFDRFHSLDDIRGLCIAAFWQPYLSWKLSGLSIRMATELNLHHAFYEAFDEPGTADEARKEALEKARLWYVLYVLDHQSSITFGRPPVTTGLRPVKEYDTVLGADQCNPRDRMLISQVAGLAVLSRAFDHFGLHPRRTMDGDDSTVMAHDRFSEALNAWRAKFTALIESDQQSDLALHRGVELQYHFGCLVLNSLVLRGRPLDKLQDLPVVLRPLALKAVEAAHAILQQFLDEPHHREEIIGMPLYLHSMIAFAVVFLMKLSNRWHSIGISIDASQRTIPLLENVIKMLHDCKAGANHMVYAMGKGFDRMLRQLKRNNRIDVQQQSPIDVMHWHSGNNTARQQPSAMSNSKLLNAGSAGSEAQFFDPTMPALSTEVPGNFVAPENFGSRATQSLDWGFQDDELWSVGIGYDLLAPGGQGLASMDFPFQMSPYDEYLPPA